MNKLLLSIVLVAALAVVTSTGCAAPARGGASYDAGSHAGHNH